MTGIAGTSSYHYVKCQKASTHAPTHPRRNSYHTHENTHNTHTPTHPASGLLIPTPRMQVGPRILHFKLRPLSRRPNSDALKTFGAEFNTRSFQVVFFDPHMLPYTCTINIFIYKYHPHTFLAGGPKLLGSPFPPLMNDHQVLVVI